MDWLSFTLGTTTGATALSGWIWGAFQRVKVAKAELARSRFEGDCRLKDIAIERAGEKHAALEVFQEQEKREHIVEAKRLEEVIFDLKRRLRNVIDTSEKLGLDSPAFRDALFAELRDLSMPDLSSLSEDPNDATPSSIGSEDTTPVLPHRTTTKTNSGDDPSDKGGNK
jgi:hypothetical protein